MQSGDGSGGGMEEEMVLVGFCSPLMVLFVLLLWDWTVCVI